MFFNIPQNLKQIFERKQLRPISRHDFSLLKEKKYFLRLPLRLEVAEKPEIILLKKISDIKNNFIGAIKRQNQFFLLFFQFELLLNCLIKTAQKQFAT